LQQLKGPQQRTPQIGGTAGRVPRAAERMSQDLETALRQRDRLAQDVARLQMEATAALESNERLSQQLHAARAGRDTVAVPGDTAKGFPGDRERETPESVRVALEQKVPDLL
jgi:hypothetical protein